MMMHQAVTIDRFQINSKEMTRETCQTQKSKNDRDKQAAWFLKSSIGKDSLQFLTNLLVTLCSQQELNPPRHSTLDEAQRAEMGINLEDQEETQTRPCSFLKVSIWGLDVLIVFDQIFGLAYLSPPACDHLALQRLNLMTLHIGIKQNLNLNELLMELYGEDLRFKETEIATFTVQATSIRLQD